MPLLPSQANAIVSRPNAFRYLRETFSIHLGNIRERLAETVPDKQVLTHAYRKADSLVNKWLRGRDLSTMAIFVQPLCVNGSHWVTVAVDVMENVTRFVSGPECNQYVGECITCARDFCPSHVFAYAHRPPVSEFMTRWTRDTLGRP